MNGTTQTLRIKVDVTNPGQFFACCGILELASRISVKDKPSRDANSWFNHDTDTQRWHYHLATTTTLSNIIEELTRAEIKIVNPNDNHSPIEISAPFNLRLDWWRNENRSTGKLKTWAGQMRAHSIFTTLCGEAAKFSPVPDEIDCFSHQASPSEAVSYFDSLRSANAAAQDVGFSIDRLKKGGIQFRSVLRPFVELFCLIGLQRVRPKLLESESLGEQRYAYSLWLQPIPIIIAPIAAIGELDSYDPHRYEFTNPSRTQDYRAFTTAKAITPNSGLLDRS